VRKKGVTFALYISLFSNITLSEETETKKETKKQEAHVNIDSEPAMFVAGDSLVIKPESNIDLKITEAKHSYTDYKASEETQTMAFQHAKREYLKRIAAHDKFVVFLDTNSEESYAKNPILEPQYKKQMILMFRSDISNRQYEVFQKLRAEVQDMERSSFGSITDYKEMGVRPPEDYTSVRTRRYTKEKSLYNIGLQIFFRMKRSETATPESIPDGMIDAMEMRSTRDLIDAMDIRLNLGIRDSQSISTDISSTKKNTSLSIT
jgi:hypothetical protein